MPINTNGKLRVKGLTTGGVVNLTDFISVWDTTLGDENPSIQLPLSPTGNYNFSVNWGDGNIDTITAYDQAEVTHAYATGGVYTVTITGTIEGWTFIYSGDAAKLTSITNIGPLKLGNVNSYFVGCSNLTTIGGTFDLIGTTDFNSMFENCTSLTSVNGIGSWNVSSVTTMNSMFGNTAVFNQDISGWDVSSVIDMNYMFGDATSFNQPLNSWDVSSVNDMSNMFANATAFNQPLNSWNVSAVTNMYQMFVEATSFNQPLNSWNVSSVTNMNSTFTGATSFNGNISSWDTSAVTDMHSMFEGATSFNQPLNSWNVSSVTDMIYMFSSATAFNQPLNSWDVSAVTDMNYMFAYATAFNQDISGWDVSSVTNMNSMFGDATSFNQDISLWDVSNVTDMAYMFEAAYSFNQDISGWDVSAVTVMVSFMNGKSTANFSYYDDLLNTWSALTLQNGVAWGMGTIQYTSAGATARQDIIDNYSWTITDGGELVSEFISVWDTTIESTIELPLVSSGNYNFSVNWGDGNTDTITTYDQAEKTHTYATIGTYTVTITGTIEGWQFNGGGDCEKITSITNIGPLKLGNEGAYFYGCSNLTTIGGVFDLTGTTNMVGMFGECTLLTSVNGIESWNTSAVTNMGSMFNYTEAFNQDMSGWDVSSVTNMGGMFAAALFNGDISGWDVSSVTDMSSMFQDATLFNGDISLWNVSSITTMSSMFTNATAFNQDISGWDISNVIFMDEFMNGKTTANYSYYDDLLNAWSLLTLQNGVNWEMGTIEYTSAGATARQDIIDNYSWIITDGGEGVGSFISVWNTSYGNGQPAITFPLLESGNYNFSVNWGDGNTDTITAWDQAEVTHTYATGGVKTIIITGTIEGWSFGSSNVFGQSPKLTSITNIGPLKLGNDGFYFAGCSNLTTIGGTFDLTGTTNMNGIFGYCSSLTSVNGIGSWDTSAVTNMTGMFIGASSFNQNIGGWDTGVVTTMNSMLQDATAFDQDISGWDVSNVTSMNGFMDGKSTANYSYYDNLLNAWSLLTLQNGVTFGMGTIEYTAAGAADRASIISNYSWTITDGGLAA